MRRPWTAVVLVLTAATVAVVGTETCEEALASASVSAQLTPRRVGGYLLDVAKPFTNDTCTGRACLCALGEDVYLVRAGAVVRLRQVTTSGAAVYDSVADTEGAQMVACGDDGVSLLVATQALVLLFTYANATLTLNASSASVLSDFQFAAPTATWKALAAVNATGGESDGTRSALLAVGAHTLDAGATHALTAVTWVTNATYATGGAWPLGHAGGLLVRSIALPGTLRWRTLTAVGVPNRPANAAPPVPTAVVYAQNASYAFASGSVPTTNDDMLVLFLHADVAPSSATGDASALAAAYPDLLTAYGGAGFASAARAYANADMVALRRVQPWPHYRNDTALEAATRTDGVRRVVFAPGARTSAPTWVRAYVVSVPLGGAGGSGRVNFRETAPRVWQCVLAFNASVAAAPVLGTHPTLECQTRHPFMLAATETTTSAWNLLEVMHPRPITVRAPAGAAPVDVFGVNFRLGAVRLFVPECADFGAGDILHQTLHLSGASAAASDAALLPWTPPGGPTSAFWAQARPEYPDREAWLTATGAWNQSASLWRHSYDAGVGALAPLFTRQSLCQVDVGAGEPDDDANAAEALAFAVVRHADSTPSGLVWLGTAAGLLRYQLVPAAAHVAVEVPVAGVPAVRGAFAELLRSDWPANPNAATATLRFAGAAPVAVRVQVDLVRVADTRPANESFVVALGTSDACRTGAHTLALNLRALGAWLTDGLYTLRLLETYAAVNVGPVSVLRNPDLSGAQALLIDGYAVEVSADVGMALLSVRTLARVMAARSALDTGLYVDDEDGGASVQPAPVAWWEVVPGGVDAVAAGASTVLLPASVRVTPDGTALYAVTSTHLVRLPDPFHPWNLRVAADTGLLTWESIAWPLPAWCANGTWDSVALDATEPAYALVCTYNVSAGSAWAPTADNATGRDAYPTGGAWNAPPGWPFGATNAALYVWTTPAANATVFDGWRSVALEQGPPTFEDGSARTGRFRLLAVDAGFAEMMHWYGADPFTFGVTHYAPWPAPLRALRSGAVHTEVYAVRAQDEWAVGARGAAARAVLDALNSGGPPPGVATWWQPAHAAATTAVLYALPATSYVANSNLLQADRAGGDAPYDWPFVRAPRAQPEVRWSAAPGADGVDPDGKRVAVFFPDSGGAAVVCAYETADSVDGVGIATQIGLYTNGPCRKTALLAPSLPVTDVQVLTTPSVSVLLTTADNGVNVTLSTLLVDRDLEVYPLSEVVFATTFAGARRTLAYTGLGLVAFADWEFSFDAISGRILAEGARVVTATPPGEAAWAALSVSERTLVWVDSATGALGARGTRMRNATDGAWAPPGSTAQTYLDCGLGTDSAACAAAAAAAGVGTPRRTADASAYASDVYPTSALLAPAFVRPWAGAADWYTAGYTPRLVADDAAAPWFHAETRYRVCGGGGERPRRYAGAPDVWTCYRDAVRDGALATHPRLNTSVPSCGGGFTASVSVDWVPRDGRWDTMQTLCHLTVRAPCTNVSANIHCVMTDGVEASVGWFAPADVFPVAQFRYPALEAAGVDPATRLRMCRGPELLHACLMDERACLAIEGVGVVAASCDAALWAAYTPEQTALWEVAVWRAHIATGALTWRTPVNLRLSYAAAGAPVHEGVLRADQDTIALVLPAALVRTERNCTAVEAACAETGSAALECLMFEQRSATSGRHVFAWPGLRQCAPVPLPGLLTLQAQPVTQAQASALCGPCWAPLQANGAPTPLPVARTWDPATGAPLTVDSASCACSACAPAWNDSRPCAAPNAEAACSTDPTSYFSAARLCGPGATGCAYTCTAPAYGAPACVAHNCTCTLYSSNPGAPLPCIPAPVDCTAAERVAQCGPWAATCTRHTDNALQSYECTGLPGAVRDSSALRRFTVPPHTALASARLVLGPDSAAALRVAALPDADRDPDLRGGVPHWDCGWTAQYLRTQRVVNPATGARLGYAGYEQWNATSAAGAHPLLGSLCTDVDGTLGTGLLLLTDARGTLTQWDGAAGANGTLRTGVGVTSLLTGSPARAVLPASGPLASEAARYLVLTNSPCDGTGRGTANACHAGAGHTQALVGGGGRPTRALADADGVLRFTVYDTVPGATYTLSWAAALALVRRADGVAADPAFVATGGASVYRVRVSDADTAGAVVYSDTLVSDVNATDWVRTSAAPALVARGTAVWVDFLRVRGTSADVTACANVVSDGTSSTLDYATEFCTEAADTDPSAAACMAGFVGVRTSPSGFAGACGLEVVTSLATVSRFYLRRTEGTRLLLLDDLQVERAVPAGDDGSYAPWATWRAPGAAVRLDFATGLRDETGTSIRGGAYLETAPGTVLAYEAGARTASDADRPNAAVRVADGVPVAGLNATVLRMAARDTGVAWLALPDVAEHPRDYTKSAWVRFGAGGDGGYTDADPGAYTALLADAFTPGSAEARAGAGLAPVNGFGLWGGAWLYCGSHRVARDLSDAVLVSGTLAPADRAWMPWVTPSTAALPPGARLRVNATWLAQWHHLVCRARSLTDADPVASSGLVSPVRRLVEYALYVDGAPVGARANGDATGPVVAVRPEAWELAAVSASAGPAVYRVGGVAAWASSGGGERPQAPSHVDNLGVYARALADGEIASLYLYDGDVDGAVPSARAFVARCAGGRIAAFGVCADVVAPLWSTAAFPVQLVFPMALDVNATTWGPLPLGGAANTTSASADDVVAAALAAYASLSTYADPSLTTWLRYEAALAARAPVSTGLTGCLRAAHVAGLDAGYFVAVTSRTTIMRARCRWSETAYPFTRNPAALSASGAVYSTLDLAKAACLLDARCASVQRVPADGTWQLYRRGTGEESRLAFAPGTSWLLACTRPSHTACGVYAAPDPGAQAWASTVVLRAEREIVARTAQPVRTVTNGQCVVLPAPAYRAVQAPGVADAVRLQTGGADGYTRTAWVRLTVQCESADPSARAIIYPDCVTAATTTQALDPVTVLSGGAAAVDTGAVASSCVDCDPAMPRWVVRAPVYTGCDSAATGCVPEYDPDSPNVTAPEPLFYSYTLSVRCGAQTPAWTPPVPVALVAPGGAGSVAEAVCGPYASALVYACNQTAATGLTPVCATNASDPAIVRGCVCPFFDPRALELGLLPCQGANGTLRMCGATELASLGCDRSDAATACRLACTPAGCALADPGLCYNQTVLVRTTCTEAQALDLCGPEFSVRDSDQCSVAGYVNGPGGARYLVPGTELCTCSRGNPTAVAYWRVLLSGVNASNATAVALAAASGAITATAAGTDLTAWMSARTDAQAACSCKGAVQIGSGENATWTCPAGVVLPCTDAETALACASVPPRTPDPYTIYAGTTSIIASDLQSRVAMSARRYLAVDVSTANGAGGLAVTAAARGVQTQDRCQRTGAPAIVNAWDTCPGFAPANATLRTCTVAESRTECGSETRSCVMRCIAAQPLGLDDLAGFGIQDITSTAAVPGFLANVSAASFDLKTAIALCMAVPVDPRFTSWLRYLFANGTAPGATATVPLWQCTDSCVVGCAAAPLAANTTRLKLSYSSIRKARFNAMPTTNCTRWGMCSAQRACTAVEARTLCGLVPGAGAPAATATDGVSASASLARVAYYTATLDAAPVVSYAETGGARWSSLAGDHATSCVAYEEQTVVGVRVRASNCTWACPEGFFGEACAQALNVNTSCTVQQSIAVCGAPWTTTGCTTDAYGTFHCVCAPGWGPGALDERACSGAVRTCGAARGDVARWAGAYGANCTVACQGGAYHEATGPAVGAWVNDTTGAALTQAGVAAGLVGPEDTGAPVSMGWDARWAFAFETPASSAYTWRHATGSLTGAALLTWSIAGAQWTAADQSVNDSAVWVDDVAAPGTRAVQALAGAGRTGGAYDLAADTTHTVWCTPTAPRNATPAPGVVGDNFTVAAWWFRHTDASTPAGVATVLLAAAYDGNATATPPWALVYDTSVSPARLRTTFATSVSNPGATGAGPSCTEGASAAADGACMPTGAWVHLVVTYGVFRAFDTRYVGAYALWSPVDALGTCPSVQACVPVWWSARAAQTLALSGATVARTPAAPTTRMCMCPLTGAPNADALVLRAPGTAAAIVTGAAAVAPAVSTAQTNAAGVLGIGGGADNVVSTVERRDALGAACPAAYAAATGDSGTPEATSRASVWCAAFAAVDDAALACGVGALQRAARVRTTVTIPQVAAGCGLAVTNGLALARLRGYDFGAPLEVPNPLGDIGSVTECAIFGGVQHGVAEAAPWCEYELGPLATVARGARFATFHHNNAAVGASPCTGASAQSYVLFIAPNATACTTTLRGTVELVAPSEATGIQVLCRLAQCGWVRDDDVGFGDAARATTTASAASLYRDGVRLARTQWTPASVGGIPAGPTSPVCIGSRAYATPWGVSPRGTPAPMPALLDDLRGTNADLTAPQVRALRAAERVQSALLPLGPDGATATSEACVLGAVACKPSGTEDPATGLACGTNKQRVRVVTAAGAEAPVTSSMLGSKGTRTVAHVSDATAPRTARRVWRAASDWVVGARSEPTGGRRGGGGGSRVVPEVLITVDASNADALAALLTRCGAHALAGEIDVPKSDSTGALLFNLSSPTGGACFCEAGWYTELARFGFSATDPAGTGPCTQTFRGRACTSAESALVPWTALRQSCSANAPFRCWVLCTGVSGVNETCATFTDQDCLDRAIANATCAPTTAAAVCPKPAASTQQNVAYDWACRGTCTFHAAFGAVANIAAMQTCASVYECVSSARAAIETAWVPSASMAQAPVPTAQRVYYASVPCAVLPGRQPWQFCGSGAVDCTLRCDPGAVAFVDGVATSVTNADACYAFDTCTCATSAVNTSASSANLTVRLTQTQAAPCDGSTVSTAEIAAQCGPYAAGATRYGCTSPGVGCTYTCSCLSGTGPMVAPPNWDYANGAWTALPCSAYFKPCDGPVDATEWCAGTNAAALIATVTYAYSGCTLACTAHTGAACASPPCWKQDCRVVPGTCTTDAVNRPSVTLAGPGGVPYTVDATTPGLFDRHDPACTCDARTYTMYPSREGYTTNGWCAPTQECSELAWSSVSPQGASCSASGVERVPGCCTPTNSPQAGATLRFGLDPVKAVQRDGTPWECATLCPAPSQHCTIAALSHAIGCGPNLRLVAGSCYNDGTLALGVCQLPTDLLVGAAAYVDGGPAPQCSCASGCPGCTVTDAETGAVVAMNTSHPAASQTPCPVVLSTYRNASMCALYCPSGAQTCALNFTWIGNRTALCDVGNVTYPSGVANPCGVSLAWSTPDHPERSAPIPRVVSCGTSWLDTSQSSSVSTATGTRPGGVRFSAKLACSAEEARRWCGPAAVGCKILDGVVQLSDCECRAGQDVKWPSGDESVLDAPYFGSYCIGDGDAAPCTADESQQWCGETAVSACTKRRVMVSTDYAAKVAAQLESAKRVTSANLAGAPVCDEWRVPLTSLAAAALARSMMTIDELTPDLNLDRIAYPLWALDFDHALTMGAVNASQYASQADPYQDAAGAGGYKDGFVFRAALGVDALRDRDLMNCTTFAATKLGRIVSGGEVVPWAPPYLGHNAYRMCDAAVNAPRKSGASTPTCVHYARTVMPDGGYASFAFDRLLLPLRYGDTSSADFYIPGVTMYDPGYQTTYVDWSFYDWPTIEQFGAPYSSGDSCGWLWDPAGYTMDSRFPVHDMCNNYPRAFVFGNASSTECPLKANIWYFTKAGTFAGRGVGNTAQLRPSACGNDALIMKICTPRVDASGASLYTAAALDAYHMQKATATNSSAWRHVFATRDFSGLNTWLSSVLRNGLTFSQLQDVGDSLAKATAEYMSGMDSFTLDYRGDPRNPTKWPSAAATYNSSRRVRVDGLPNADNADMPYDPTAQPSPLHVCHRWRDAAAPVFPPDVAAADRGTLRKSYLGALFAADGTRVGTAGWDNPSGTPAGARAAALWLPECTCFSNSSDMRARGAGTKLDPVRAGYGWRDLGAVVDTAALVADIRCDARLLRTTRMDPTGGICPLARNGLACAGVGTCNPTLDMTNTPATCSAAARSQCIANRLASVPDWPLMRPYGAVGKAMSPTVLVCGDDAKPAFMMPVAAASALPEAEGASATNLRLRSAAFYAARKLLYGTRLVSALGPWQGAGLTAQYYPCMRVERRNWYTPSRSVVCQSDAAAGSGALPVQLRRLGCLSDAELDAFPIQHRIDPGVPRPRSAWLAANRITESRNGDANDVRTAYAMSCATGDAAGTFGVPAVNCPAWSCSVPRVDQSCSSTGTGFELGCPLGRGGPDCAMMAQTPAAPAVPSLTSWADMKYQRMRLWGIAHLGMPCQSWKRTVAVQFSDITTVSDGAEGVDCTVRDLRTGAAPDASGRAGCVNGVWSWADAACVCDLGWSRPRDLYASRRTGWTGPVVDTAQCFPPGTMPTGAWEAAVYGLWDAHSATVPDIASAFWMCVVPGADERIGSQASMCTTDGQAPTALECLVNGVCPVCNGRGTCVTGQGCVCRQGWYGRQCQLRTAELCATASSLVGVAQLPLVDPATGDPLEQRACSGHGTCVLTNSSCNGCGATGIRAPDCCVVEGYCECVSGRGYGWAGVNCSRPYLDIVTGYVNGSVSALAQTDTCLNGGVLAADAPPSLDNATAFAVGHRVWCACPTGWTGLRCELSACPVAPNGAQCNGHGTCAFSTDTQTWSCQQPWVCSRTQSDPAFSRYCSKFTQWRNTCIQPGGFTDANPPGRWRGAACEIDTMQWCGLSGDGGQTWTVCNGGALGSRTAPSSDGAYQDACVAVPANTTRTPAYYCRCGDIAPGLSGAHCELSACSDPAVGAGDTCGSLSRTCVAAPSSPACRARPGLCRNGIACVCTDENLDSAYDTVQKRLFMNLGNTPTQPWCSEDVTACGAYINSATREFRATSANLAGSFGWGLFRCKAGTGAAVRGVCARDLSRAGSPYACFCDAALSTRCVDNRCLTCTGIANGTTPLPTFGGVPTAAPTAVPTAVPTTAAPTAPVSWNFAYQALVGSEGDDAGVYTLEPGAPVPGGAIYGVRSGLLHDDTVATFSIAPALPAGLVLDATSGNITGTPTALSLSVTQYAVTVTFSAGGGGGTQSAAFVLTLAVDEPCGDGAGCGSHGACVRTDGAAHATCVCTGLWVRASASDTRSMCLNHTCTPPSVPGDAPEAAAVVTTGTATGLGADVCVCASSAGRTPASACTESGCTSDPSTGELCGPSMAYDRVVGVNGTATGKACVVAYNAATRAPTYTCACAGAYTLNASSGRCVPLCDTENTERVVVLTNAPAGATPRVGVTVACVPRPNGAQPWDPATGNVYRWCMHNATLDAATQTRCVCAWPFTGTSCTVEVPAPDGSARTVLVARTGAQCECAACGAFGALNCTVARDSTRCTGTDATPSCTCRGLAAGASCDQHPCNAALGGALSADGLSCVCGGGDPAHAYGGPYCNVSRCAHGAPVQRTAAGLYRCVCPTDPNVDPRTVDALCAGTCVANSERLTDSSPCTCVPPYAPAASGVGCTTRCGVATGTLYGSWPLVPSPQCFCTPPYNATTNSVCPCDTGQPASQCVVAGRCNPAYAALAGTGTRAVLRGARQCVCEVPNRWRGLYCTESACGPMGVPVSADPTSTRGWQYPTDCDCDPAQSVRALKRAKKVVEALVTAGQVWCQPTPTLFACNGGTFDPITGRCTCTADCTGDPWCDNCPGRVGGGGPATFAPTNAPTLAPPEAPTTASPTDHPSVAPTTAAPTPLPGNPTAAPTTASPTAAPTTASPTAAPTTARPTAAPTTARPTAAPTTARPTTAPTAAPTTAQPGGSPTNGPATCTGTTDSSGALVGGSTANSACNATEPTAPGSNTGGDQNSTDRGPTPPPEEVGGDSGGGVDAGTIAGAVVGGVVGAGVLYFVLKCWCWMKR